MLEKAVSIKPDYLKARLNLGVAYFLMKLYDEAIKEYKVYLQYKSTDLNVRLQLGVAVRQVAILDGIHVQGATPAAITLKVGLLYLCPNQSGREADPMTPVVCRSLLKKIK